MSWYIYILLCDSKSYYVGLSSNVIKRVNSHKNKQNIGTKEFDTVELVYQEKYKTRIDAAKREIQLKGWSKAKKKALIEGNLDLLIKLSKSQSMVKGDKQ